jgi:cytochrome c553
VRIFQSALPFALLLSFVAGAAAQQQPRNNDAGLPWAYGFAGAVPSPAPAPAAPAAAAEEPATLLHLPGATPAFTTKQIDNNFGPADWFPDLHPAMPKIVAEGRKPDVRACGFCHYPNGKGRPNNAGIAGLPAAYIVQQLQNFSNGDRRSWDPRKGNTSLMIGIAKNMTAEEMKSAAAYFSSMKWTPWIRVVETDTVPKTHFVGGGGGLCLPLEGPEAGTEPIGRRIVEVPENVEATELRDPRSGFIAYVPPGSIKRGEILATTGGGKTFGCANCHGAGLAGDARFGVPSIAGRSPSYMAQQLYDIQKGARTDYSRMMKETVANLSEDDILDIVAYVASLPPQPKSPAAAPTGAK